MNKKVKDQEKVKIFSSKKIKDPTDKIISKLCNSQVDVSKVKCFKDFPLSPPTLKGLKDSGYEIPTEIQKESLVHSLKGLDILGAAKTGSGKTLAFLIPVLETLFKLKWTRYDGTGALIITPTRELAYQIFENLRNVGFYHDFSAGLIIGGKDLHFEKHRMDKVNIIICTPGRLLQHMDENPLFCCDNMQVLVLDEADRCLDLGFEKTMNCIIENLPAERQTLLFSATQTKSVKDLARLSLKDPKYISVHENAQYSTPEGLNQSYVVCELHDKMAMLWSFIKNHPKHKILVFLSSCKQVKYTNEIFCKLRPSIGLLALYGSLHQEKRMSIYNSFSNKQHAVLFATDIAARGLDFPEVNWVVQLDCPEDVNTYIHRAGRTARYQKGGESLLVLLPSEKDSMLEQLEKRKIPINEIKVNPMKLTNPQIKMEAFLARDPNLKASAQRAFQSYFKSVFLMKDKSIFKVSALNPDTYARSLGLVVSPRIRFLQKHNKTQLKNKSGNSEDFGGIQGSQRDEEENVRVSFQAQEVPRGKETYNFGGEDSDSDDDILVMKRKDHELEGIVDGDPLVIDDTFSKKKLITKAALAKKVLKKNIVANKKFVFTDTGDIEVDQMKVKTTEEGKHYEEAEEGGIDISEAKKVMKAEDKIDRKLFREKNKAKHREKKLKEKKLKKKERNNMDEEKAYSGSESDSSGPDLSWLPDPDKVYSKNPASDSEDLQDNQSNASASDKQPSSDDESNVPERTLKTKKRKKKTDITQHSKRQKNTFIVEEHETKPTGLTLEEDEDLVLKLLSHKT